MRTRLATTAFLLMLSAAAAWQLLRRDPIETAVAARPAAPATTAPEPSEPQAPPASLRETEIDGDLALGPDGHFAPSRPALALFDYFLSAHGEEAPARIRARIEAEIARRLPAEAAREALAFLDRYLAYRDEGARVAADSRLAESADFERRLQWLRELRRAQFGAELAELLFGAEERSVEDALARRRIASDSSLPKTERRARLEALEDALPESTRAARAAATLPTRLAEEEKALRAAGASDAQVRALREQWVGPEASERLAALDRRRAEWTRRVDAHRAARDAIVADATLAPAERAAELESLRALGFDETERLRVRAIDDTEIGAAR